MKMLQKRKNYRQKFSKKFFYILFHLAFDLMRPYITAILLFLSLNDKLEP